MRRWLGDENFVPQNILPLAIYFTFTLKFGTKFTFLLKKDKYTIDPGQQIYLSNNTNKFGQKWFLNNKIKKNSLKKNFLEEKFGKNKTLNFFLRKFFFRKKIWQFFLKNKCQLQVTIPSTHHVQIWSRSGYCITQS